MCARWCVALKLHLTKRKQLAEGGARGCQLPTAMTDSRGSAAPFHPALEIRRDLSQDPEKLALSGPQANLLFLAKEPALLHLPAPEPAFVVTLLKGSGSRVE